MSAMAAVTVSSLPESDMPPVGVIEADDTFTAVLPLDDICVFVAVETPMRTALADTLTLLAAACRQAEPVT